MKQLKNLLTLIFVLTSVQSFAQSNYYIGTGLAGIEPDQSLISLHLGGYGAPRAGRFTLQWINKKTVPEVSAFAGISNTLYIISKGKLLRMKPSENESKWIIAGKTKNIKDITESDGKLYAINTDGELLAAKSGKEIKWKKIGSVDKSVNAITVFNNSLIVASILYLFE